MVLKCLFLVSDNIIIYKEKDNKLNPIKYKGDIFYTGEMSDLTNWFEDKSGYIENETKLDICVLKIIDKNFKIDFSRYDFVEESSWNSLDIENVLIKKSSKSKIKINDEYVEIINKDKIIKGQEFSIFELNLYPNKESLFEDYNNHKKEEYKKTKSIECKLEKNSNKGVQLFEEDVDNKEGVLARYYRQKTSELNKI